MIKITLHYIFTIVNHVRTREDIRKSCMGKLFNIDLNIHLHFMFTPYEPQDAYVHYCK